MWSIIHWISLCDNLYYAKLETNIWTKAITGVGWRKLNCSKKLLVLCRRMSYCLLKTVRVKFEVIKVESIILFFILTKNRPIDIGFSYYIRECLLEFQYAGLQIIPNAT